MDNSLRKKLIREVLDNDKHINNRVSQIQLRKIPKDETRVLYIQLNKEEIQKLNIFVASLRKSFEQKAIIAKIMADRALRFNKFNSYIIEICSVGEILTMYNYSVNVYKKK